MKPVDENARIELYFGERNGEGGLVFRVNGDTDTLLSMLASATASIMSRVTEDREDLEQAVIEFGKVVMQQIDTEIK